MGCFCSLPKDQVVIDTTKPNHTDMIKLHHSYLVTGFLRIYSKQHITNYITDIIAQFCEPEKTPKSILESYYQCQFCMGRVTKSDGKKKMYSYDFRQCANKQCNAIVLTSATCDNDESIECALELFSVKITSKMRGYVWLWVIGLEKKGVFMRVQDELDLNSDPKSHNMFDVVQPIWFRKYGWKIIENTVKNALNSYQLTANIKKQICQYIDWRKLEI
eukprot:102529_1